MVTQTKPAPRYIRPKHFIEETGMPERTVYALLEAGEIHGFQIGRSWYLPASELDDFFARARKAA